jgi:hypothetical protein
MFAIADIASIAAIAASLAIVVYNIKIELKARL